MLQTFTEIVDEIYNEVSNLEPFEKGTTRISSVAFSILYRMFELGLTRKQMNAILTHQDSPYIRALGVIYLRYLAPPDQLWEWVSPLLDDTEEFSPTTDESKTMTMSAWVEGILTENRFEGTVFPRIPVAVEREIKVQLLRRKSERQSTASLAPGMIVRAMYSEASFFCLA